MNFICVCKIIYVENLFDIQNKQNNLRESTELGINKTYDNPKEKKERKKKNIFLVTRILHIAAHVKNDTKTCQSPEYLSMELFIYIYAYI